jgi:hypothetical protein
MIFSYFPSFASYERCVQLVKTLVLCSSTSGGHCTYTLIRYWQQVGILKSEIVSGDGRFAFQNECVSFFKKNICCHDTWLVPVQYPKHKNLKNRNDASSFA